MSKLDCYAILGLSPTAEDAVIRAAYLALMRSYHPDRNGSPEAAARARAITEAYKTIGDPARRAEYDARRWEPFEFLDRDDDDEVERPPRQWGKAPVIGAVAASAMALVLAVTLLPLPQSERAETPQPPVAARPPVESVVGERAAAARLPTPQREQPPVPAVSSRLLETSPPPAPAPTAPEKALTPERALAIARPAPVKADQSPRPRRTAEAPSPPTAGRTAPAKPAPVNEKARVAALEWQSTSFYNQSVNHADGARRAQLQQARDLFVTSRNACRSDSCVGDAHVSYMRDISRIMQKPKAVDP